MKYLRTFLILIPSLIGAGLGANQLGRSSGYCDGLRVATIRNAQRMEIVGVEFGNTPALGEWVTVVARTQGNRVGRFRIWTESHADGIHQVDWLPDSGDIVYGRNIVTRLRQDWNVERVKE